MPPPPPPPASGNHRISRKPKNVLLRLVLSMSAVAVLGGAYWQQQLLHGLALVSGPKHSIDNVLRESRRGATTKQNIGITPQQQENRQTKESPDDTQHDEEEEEPDDRQQQQQQDTAAADSTSSDYTLPPALQAVLDRATQSRSDCDALDLPIQPPPNMSLPHLRHPVADLPNFGIIHALSNYRPSSPAEAQEWNCQAPPPQECDETQFTVIFMGYRPERLGPLKRHVIKFTGHTSHWKPLVREVILVWNGPRELTSTQDGKHLFEMSQDDSRPFRIFFPLKEGFPNDLMNRYHPRFNVTTKGILYYDDDGPFYSYDAVLAGFELWKRNANAEIGAMARKIDLSPRQNEEQSTHSLSDLFFVKQCRNKGDFAKYNFFEFTNYHARMVLPSGSFLHRNYMCFLWHPALEKVREFVRAHPVHPDDCTVSTIVSQIGGRAPKVYSRRINSAKPKQTVNVTADTKRRRLLQQQGDANMRRRLLWADVSEQEWSSMRSMAINSLASYFGSINSGSLGWCHDTPYQKQGRKGGWVCDPQMANIGMLTWMTEENRPKDTCP